MADKDKKYVKINPEEIARIGKDEVRRVLSRTQKRIVDQTKSRPSKGNASANQENELKVYHDWEFLETNNSVHPISVGMVTEDGYELYYEFIDAPWGKILKHEWLVANVIPKLSANHNAAIVSGVGNDIVRSTLSIRMKVHEFLKAANSRGKDPLQLWGWYSSYDHVCLGQLFGAMVNLPEFIPMWTNDIKQEAERYNFRIPDLRTHKEPIHHALADAKVEREMHEWLMHQEYLMNTFRSNSGFQIGNGNTQVNRY